MNILISIALVLFLVATASWKIRRANRLAAELAGKQELARRKKEEEILARLEKIRKKTDLDHAKRLIEKDPECAAKVVSKMMKRG